MEFFRVIDVQTTVEAIQQDISLDRLDAYCQSLFLLEKENDLIKVGSVWGEFSFFRLEVTGGLRMGLLDCPNALSWTITTGYPPEKDKIILHLTINRTEKADEFISEIHDFMDDWEEGLLQHRQAFAKSLAAQ